MSSLTVKHDAKWHLAMDGKNTICGINLPLIQSEEFSDVVWNTEDVEVDCMRCKRAIRAAMNYATRRVTAKPKPMPNGTWVFRTSR